jgi:hypothetical protein
LIDMRPGNNTGDGSVAVVLDAYRLVSIESTIAPAPADGDDWLVYTISQGTNVVTGYRRGTRASVTYEVERIVDAFNDRLLVRPRVNRWTGKPVAPNPRALLPNAR